MQISLLKRILLHGALRLFRILASPLKVTPPLPSLCIFNVTARRAQPCQTVSIVAFELPRLHWRGLPWKVYPSSPEANATYRVHAHTKLQLWHTIFRPSGYGYTAFGDRTKIKLADNGSSDPIRNAMTKSPQWGIPSGLLYDGSPEQ